MLPRLAQRRTAGFTLVEIIVVLGIVATVAGLGVYALGGAANGRVQAEALRMSGALRMTYGRAAINGLRYQFVMSLDDGAYRVECSSENVLVEGGATREEERRNRRRDDEADPFGIGAPQPTLEDCSEDALPQGTTRRGVRIARVLTTHHEEPVEEGEAAIAFFPNGFVERTLIWLSDDDERVFVTISIDPMSGRVRTYAEDLDVPEDFFEVEED
jgi:prepilin-type N-terminal cleavage/methylation domain-containing protein